MNADLDHSEPGVGKGLQRTAWCSEQSFPGTWKVRKKKVFAGRKDSSKWVTTQRTKGGVNLEHAVK